MPTVEENAREWNVEYGWRDHGETWSTAWGGSRAQWFGAILPRIHAFLPATTILEIAPGFGRWTTHLKDHCEHLILVDLAENCIKACQRRFADASHISYHVNDGKSLSMIPDRSIDFAFSFDSLVHAEADVLQAYLDQLATKLKPDGVGFFHHSNIGAYRRSFSINQRLPKVLADGLIRRRILDQTHWRAFTMTASLFHGCCERAGLQCVSQELVNWSTRRLIDCFSVFTPKSSGWARPAVVLENPGFMREAAMIRRLSQLYGGPRLQSAGQGA